MAVILKPENVAQLVFFIRGERVMFDADLAMLYGVRTKALNQALFRNKGRFPEDFAFQHTKKEFDSFEVTNCDLIRPPKVGSLLRVALRKSFD
jgi:ORF6N domain